MIWVPLEKHLEGIESVLLSPDGVLGRFPIAALPGKVAGTYLIEELTFAVVPAARAIPSILSATSPSKKVAENMLLLGGVDYDVDLSEALVENSPDSEKQFGRRTAVRGDESMTFRAISGTVGEIATIAAIYIENYGNEGMTTLKGAAANETFFRREAPRHLFLHLATHGFFAPAEVRSALSGDAGYDPGLLSGIALAGANRPQKDGDDGIVTAEEVETLDLRGTQLAVLSACETGLGEVAGGEGLLGLQRAFQVAGAKTVIASLWKVDDRATRDLMERFYKNLWTDEMGTQEALREAQLWMLKEGATRGAVNLTEDAADSEPTNLPPFYWAAFVLSGDWQ